MPYNPIVIPMSVASDSEALEMSVAVSIGGGSILGTKEITNNGVYNASSDGLDGYSSVDVQVAGGSTLGEKSVTANGTYNASSDNLDGYSKVTVNVPASAVDTGTKNISTNGTHNVIGYASANVSVPASAVDTGTKQITSNGNGQDVVGYAAVDVAVPNSYSAGDEGKVVSNGALVAQTAHADVTPTTSDQTIDTTTNNSIKVKGDANLVAGNIKKDVTIFNVTGTYEGGGGAPARLLNDIEITPASTYTSSNKGTVQLTPSDSCIVFYQIDERPSAPDSTEYIALCGMISRFGSYGSGTNSGIILRPAGTIGSDGNQALFDATTGVLSLGGGSGHFMAGKKYHIYQFEVGAPTP